MTAFGTLMAAVDRSAQRLLGGEPVIYTSVIGSASASGVAFQSGAFQSTGFQFVGGSAPTESVTVIGIFDAAFVLAKGDAHAGVEAVAPAVFLQLADLPVDPEDDDPTLTIRGLNYRVIERVTADFGSIVLALRRVV